MLGVTVGCSLLIALLTVATAGGQDGDLVQGSSKMVPFQAQRASLCTTQMTRLFIIQAAFLVILSLDIYRVCGGEQLRPRLSQMVHPTHIRG